MSEPASTESPPAPAVGARAEIRESLAEAFPVVVAIVPFGILFGALATDAGLALGQALGLSGALYAGASQLVLLQLMALGTPLWSILLAVAAVNFRHVLYSASVGRHLGRFSGLQKAFAFYFLVDPVFAASEERARRRPITPAYYFAFGLFMYVAWMIATLVGALSGSLIGDQRAIGLDLLLPVYFLALTLQFRNRAGFLPTFLVAGLVSIIVYLTLGTPWHVMLGGLAGIASAAILPPRQERPEGHGA